MTSLQMGDRLSALMILKLGVLDAATGYSIFNLLACGGWLFIHTAEKPQ